MCVQAGFLTFTRQLFYSDDSQSGTCSLSASGLQPHLLFIYLFLNETKPFEPQRSHPPRQQEDSSCSADTSVFYFSLEVRKFRLVSDLRFTARWSHLMFNREGGRLYFPLFVSLVSCFPSRSRRLYSPTPTTYLQMSC